MNKFQLTKLVKIKEDEMRAAYRKYIKSMFPSFDEEDIVDVMIGVEMSVNFSEEAKRIIMLESVPDKDRKLVLSISRGSYGILGGKDNE